MADKIIKMQDANGDNAYPVAALGIPSSNSSVWTYNIFARVAKSATYNYGTLLISGYDGVNTTRNFAYGGVALLQIKNYNNVLMMCVTKLAPNTSDIKFGYYDGGDGYWYIGVYSPPYKWISGVTPIANPTDIARSVQVADYSFTTAAPTGWTEVGFSGECRFPAGTSTAGTYIAFARFPLGASSAKAHTSLLVSGGGNYASIKLGAFILDCGGKGTNSCQQTTLVSPGTAVDMGFGSYIQDGYVYIGMKRPAYSSEFTVRVLNDAFNVAAITSNTELATFYNSTTMPTGWVAATTA